MDAEKEEITDCDSEIDICGETCPFTFVLTKVALEKLRKGQRLMIVLDYPPAVENIPQSAVAQKLAETLLGNQIAETIFLTDGARTSGAVASSAFGAGFGGSVWAIVPSNSAEEFIIEWGRNIPGKISRPR